MERLEQRRHLAAAVGRERDVVGEEMREPVGALPGDRGLEGGQQALLRLGRRDVADPRLIDVGARPRDQLAAGGLGHLERRRDLGIVDVEDLVQQVGRALPGREALEHQEERRRERGGERRVRLGVALGRGVDRLRQPGADIVDARPVGRPQQVEAAARAGGGEPGGRVPDAAAIRRAPFEEGVLHRILGVGARAEDAVGEPEEPRTRRLEGQDVVASAHLSGSPR
jgi:hypothetical protein